MNRMLAASTLTAAAVVLTGCSSAAHHAAATASAKPAVTATQATALTGNALACQRFAGIAGALDGILSSAGTVPGALSAASVRTLKTDAADISAWAKGTTTTATGPPANLFLGGDMADAALGVSLVAPSRRYPENALSAAHDALTKVAVVTSACASLKGS